MNPPGLRRTRTLDSKGSTHSRGLRQNRGGPALGRSNTIESGGSNRGRSTSPTTLNRAVSGGRYTPASPTARAAPPLVRSATNAGAARAAPPLLRSNTGGGGGQHRSSTRSNSPPPQRRPTRRGLRKNLTSDGSEQLLGGRARGLRNSTHQRGLSGSVHQRQSNASTIAGPGNYLSQLHNVAEPNCLAGVNAENQGSTSNLNFNMSSRSLRDDSEKSPILGDLDFGRPELDRQISGISCLSFEDEEEIQQETFPSRKSERRTFEDMCGEAQSVASGEKRLAQEHDQYEMEVSPGYFLPFRGSAETYQQIQKGNSLETCCLECGRELVSVADCQCVVCSECQMVNPVFEYPPHVDASKVHGIGMGFQKEWVLKKQQEELHRSQTLFVGLKRDY